MKKEQDSFFRTLPETFDPLRGWSDRIGEDNLSLCAVVTREGMVSGNFDSLS